MAGLPSSYEDAGASDHEPPVRVQLRPVSGAQIVGWLLHLEQFPERGGVRLESFDDHTAIVSIDPPAFGALIPLLAAGEEPPPAVQLLPAPTPLSAEPPAPPRPSGGRAPAGAPSSRRSSRLLRIGALVAAAALAVAAGFAAGWLLHDETDGRANTDLPLGDVTATVAPAPTPAPSPTAAPSPTPPPPHARMARDLTGACIPEPGASRCDVARAALWSGDAAAWRDWATRRGEPPPAPAEVTACTIGLRLAAADPAARVAFARATNAPLPLIAAIHVEWRAGRTALLAVEVANLGTRPIDLSGAFIPGLGSLSGTRLAPGDRCAIGAGADIPPCPGTVSAVPPELTAGEWVWLLGADGGELDQMSVP